MIKRCIITPTYKGHFKFIDTYLKSFCEFLEDKDFPIFFIITKKEYSEFKKLICKYQDTLNINVVFLESIFKKYKIDKTPDYVLKKYGRLSFQTIKKLYGALYINYDQFLLLDSESLLIRSTNMNSLFDRYFKQPNFLASKVSERFSEYKNCFTYNYIKTVSNILGNPPKYWLVESYNWFYELRILNDLINEYGDPIDIIKKCSLNNKFKDAEGVLECLLYYQYIINNNDRYKYKVIILDDVLPDYLKSEYDVFKKRFNNSDINICGIFEQFTRLIDINNIDGFIRFINDFNLKILRMENSFNNYLLQKKILQICKVNILASNQDHCFDYDIIKKQFETEKNCIITPTYTEHFKYIKKFLKSFQKYAQPKNNFCIYFIINSDEYLKFKTIVKKYQNSINFKILIFEDLLQYYNISETPQQLLNKFGKFSFQTLKKFYAMLYIGDNHRFLILDSESMLTHDTNINNLFDMYFQQPFVLYSELENRKNTQPFLLDVNQNINYILHNQMSNKWFLETFMWFYDYKILERLFSLYGSPIEIVSKVYNHLLKNNQNVFTGVFEIILYNSFLYKLKNIYSYNFINVDEMLLNILNEKQLEKYKTKFSEMFAGGNGVVEMIMVLLTKNNIIPLANLFKQLHINIIRCEFTNIKNYRLQKKFLKIVRPNILAASQNHLWGINNNFSNRFNIFIRNSKSYEKLKKHIKNFLFPFQVIENGIKKFLVALLSGIKRYIVRPLCYFFKWITEPFSILFYLFKLVMRFMKIF